MNLALPLLLLLDAAHAWSIPPRQITIATPALVGGGFIVVSSTAEAMAQYVLWQRLPLGFPRASEAVALAGANTIASLASRAAHAMNHGRAHVEPEFLSGVELASARADIINVLAQITNGDSVGFESIQTDLLKPEFRQSQQLPFSGLLGKLDELRASLAQCTGRSLLEGGGLHLMRYPVGSKFMRHVDEDPSLYEPERNSISFLIYLTPDDWTAAHGGALCVYEGEEGSEVRQVLPISGTLVIYDSTMEHEVLPTMRERHLLSGRFRELDDNWQRRRS